MSVWIIKSAKLLHNFLDSITSPSSDNKIWHFISGILKLRDLYINKQSIVIKMKNWDVVIAETKVTLANSTAYYFVISSLFPTTIKIQPC